MYRIGKPTKSGLREAGLDVEACVQWFLQAGFAVPT
jgi:hypothetical protein